MIRPNIYVKDVTEVDYKKVFEAGIKVICFDIDNTLDTPDEMTTSIREDISKTLDEVEEMGFDVFLISNNTIPGRAASFANLRGYDYMDCAQKPFQKKYKTADFSKKYEKNEILFVGDKLVTDILGARWYGSRSILVDQLVPKNKKWYTRFMNFAEQVFCALNGFKKGEYFVEEM